MLIRECLADDVTALERLAPTGANDGHGRRFRRQRAGESAFLIAIRDGVPVGSGEVIWGGCADANVRAECPNCPEINGLSVFPAELRGQGIGTELIVAAEERALARGFSRIGLGVALENPDAARLYLRLGYVPRIRYVDTYSYLDDSGTKHVVNDPATFLVKELR